MKLLAYLTRLDSTWAILDSGVTSLLSLVVVIASTRIGGVETAGRVALLASVVLASIGFFRLGIGLPFIKSISSGNSQPTKMVSLVVLPAVMIVVVVGGVLASIFHSFILIAGALWVATSLLQDAERYLLIARKHYIRLFIVDSFAFSVVVIGLFFANSPSGIALAVSLGLTLSTIGAKAFSRSLPNLGIRNSLRTWWLDLRSAAGPLLLDGLVFTIVSQSLVWTLAIRSSVDEVGILRVAMLLAFPLSVIQAGVSNPILQNLAALNLRAVGHFSRKLSLQIGAAASGLALVSLLFLPVINHVMLAPPAAVGLILSVLVLGNAVLIFALEPLSRACIVEGRVMGMAFWRALAGMLAFLIVLSTNLGTSASGVAVAVLVGQCVFAIALWVMLRARRDSRPFGNFQGL